MKELIEIQAELKAPKNQRNTFGKYNYRSCEDILEAVKPLLKEHGCTLTITDEIKEIGGIVFVEATATIRERSDSNGVAHYDASDNELVYHNQVEVKAQAGINPDRKGMDIAQSFGSSSSYARKYALNGLFLIDDTKDADATNEHKTETKPPLTDAIMNKVVNAIFEGKGTIEQAKTKYDISERQEVSIKAMIQARG